MNEKNVKKFTDVLWDLLVNKELTLRGALQIMAREKDGKNRIVIKAAENILDGLNCGWNFSYVLAVCPFLKFDKVYVAFMGFAEKTGNLKASINFLHEKYKRREENYSRLISAGAYPAFVILLAVMIVFVLLRYGKTILMETGISNEVQREMVSGISVSFLVLFGFCFLVFALLRGIFRGNGLYEAFLAAGFLTDEGVSLSEAVTTAANILGPETREGLLFEQARERLSWGMKLDEAFTTENEGGSNRALSLEISNAFYYAQSAGGRNDAFEKVAVWLGAKEEKRRELFSKLIEPAFICGTGAFLLVFLLNLITPVLNSNLLGM